MIERRSTLLFIFLLTSLALVGLMFVHALVMRRIDRPLLRERAEMVRVLGLDDLCLFTEARYTRHPVMADLNSPFQDYPMSLEHFPSGSIVPVPPHLKARGRR
jgi:hypothetical protein